MLVLGVLLAAQPYVSPESLVTQAVPAPWGGLTANNWGAPPLAADFDGTNHVVVWIDGRANALMAARVSPAGTVLDPSGVVLRSGADAMGILSGHVAIAFDGSQHLVVFEPMADRGGYVDANVSAIRVSRTLQPIDTTPIVISTQPIPLAPAAAFDGTQFIVAWSSGTSPSSTGSNTDRHAARVATNGTVLDPSGIVLESGMTPGYYPGRLGAASAGGVTALVWQSVHTDASNIPSYQSRARRLRGDGTWLDPAPIALGSPGRYQALPAVASRGTEFLVAWNEGQFSTTATFSAKAARLGTSGALGASIPIHSGGIELNDAGPAIDWAGTEWHLAYAQGNGVGPLGARVSQSGTLLGTAPLPAIPSAIYPLLSWNGQSELWVTGSYEMGGGFFVRGHRLDTQLAGLEPQPIEISRAAPMQDQVAVAGSPQGALAAWFEGNGHWPMSLRAARLDADGNSLDPNGIDVAPGATESAGFTSIAASFNGTDYLVTWIDRRGGTATYEDIYAARVSPAGVVRDPNGIPVAVRPSTQYNVAVGSEPGGRSLVCWHDPAPGGLYCARVDASGQVLDLNGGLTLWTPSQTTEAGAPCVASIGDQFYVAWHAIDPWASSPTPGTLMLRSVDPATGTLGMPVTVSSQSYWPTAPAFGSGASEGLLVFVESRPGLVASDVVAVGVSAAGQLGAAVSVSPSGSAPRVAPAGSEWLISWLEPGTPPSSTRLVARRWSGSAFVEAAFPVVIGQVYSGLAIAGTDGHWIGGYSRMIDDPSIFNVRAAVRVIGGTAVPRDAGVEDSSPIDAGALDGAAGADASAADSGALDAGVGGDGGPGSDGGAGGDLVFTSMPETRAKCDRSYTYLAEAVASGGATVTYALSEHPAGMTVDATSGSVRWDPAAEQNGDVAVEVIASDGRSTVRQLYTLEVRCDVVTLASDGCQCSAAPARRPGRNLLPMAACAALIVLRRRRFRGQAPRRQRPGRRAWPPAPAAIPRVHGR